MQKKVKILIAIGLIVFAVGISYAAYVATVNSSNENPPNTINTGSIIIFPQRQ